MEVSIGGMIGLYGGMICGLLGWCLDGKRPEKIEVWMSYTTTFGKRQDPIHGM